MQFIHLLRKLTKNTVIESHKYYDRTLKTDNTIAKAIYTRTSLTVPVSDLKDWILYSKADRNYHSTSERDSPTQTEF